MTQNPNIQSAVMFGRGKAQGGVLIEPAAHLKVEAGNTAEGEQFIHEIWYAASYLFL